MSKLHSDLPPGTVLGPDGKPCKVCTGADWRSWSKIPKTNTTAGSSSSTTGAAVATGAVAAAASNASSSIGDGCPVNVEQLGRATWTFLHTAAAYYPTHPTPAQKSSMLSLLKSLPLTYPCHHCASHLDENMVANPPDTHVADRGALSKYLCERHNDVNVRLGKAKFDCLKTDERWLSGPADGSCD
ncbi:FAD-dependent thiol oxidase [Clavulina sp. PMI_390]|nr:FAD-dependent thiol oxidase [Clavulina sp. PMI_390]